MIRDKDISGAIGRLLPLMNEDMMASLGTHSHFSTGDSVVLYHNYKCARAIFCHSVDAQFATIFLLDFAIFRTVPIVALERMNSQFCTVPQGAFLGSLSWLHYETTGKHLIAQLSPEHSSLRVGAEKVPIYLFCRKMFLRSENLDMLIDDFSHIDIEPRERILSG
uniref:Cleavage/polyadenylation specificity factor A subunit C-terminal domain-containing protein n=1 Tax=Trichuris muris TaxID=70415 RepID=A0A5S6QQL4_TRIMR